MMPDSEWRMPVSQADGAKMFPIGTSRATVGFFAYKDAERLFAGGGIWAMLLVDGHPYVVATNHIFVTTPEKVDPSRLGEGIPFYHLHVKPQKIVEKPFEHPIILPEFFGWNELDYAVSQVCNLHMLRVLLSGDGHYEIAKQIKVEDVAKVERAIRAYYCSPEAVEAAIINGAPEYWLRVQGRIAGVLDPPVRLTEAEAAAAGV